MKVSDNEENTGSNLTNGEETIAEDANTKNGEEETAKDAVKDDKMDEKEKKKTSKKKSSESKSSKLKKELKEKEGQFKEMQEKYVRLSAEFDNYRKRTLKEKMDLIKYASEDILKDLLPVVDDFDRALNNITEASDLAALKEGMELINNKFKSFITQKGLKEIEALNQDFDMDLHEAITKIPAPEENLKGKIVDVIEKGYYLNDKVIRFAKVVIGE